MVKMIATFHNKARVFLTKLAVNFVEKSKTKNLFEEIY